MATAAGNFDPTSTDTTEDQLEKKEMTRSLSARIAATAARLASSQSKLPIYRPRPADLPPREEKRKTAALGVSASAVKEKITLQPTQGGSTMAKAMKAMEVDELEVSPYFSAFGQGSGGGSTADAISMPAYKRMKGSNPLRLGRDFMDQECVDLCRALLGKVLCRKIPATGEVLRGTIVETEAYPGNEDKASQSYQGKRTPRNEAMFMQPGTAYVYFTYGMYYCFNISSRGDGAACLLRAIEPLEDYDTMHHLRNLPSKKSQQEANNNETSPSKKKRLNLHELANGPSKLCMAFDIKRESCDKIDMVTSNELWLEQSLDLKFRNGDFEIATDKRIGIDSTPPEARNKLWRFYVKDNWSESRAKVGELKKKAKLELQGAEGGRNK